MQASLNLITNHSPLSQKSSCEPKKALIRKNKLGRYLLIGRAAHATHLPKPFTVELDCETKLDDATALIDKSLKHGPIQLFFTREGCAMFQ